MTQQVRTGYRKHRKAAWGLALLVVAAIAAVTIPLASGAPSKTLKFTPSGQPPSLWQSSAPATGADISVAVYSGGPNAVNSNPPPTPELSWSGPGLVNSNFDVTGPNYSSTTKSWTWHVTANSSTPSGTFTFGATLGDLVAAPSSSFRVAQYVCPGGGGPSCNGTSNFGDAGQGKLNIANTLATPVLLDFSPADPAAAPEGCKNDGPVNHTWNRAFYFAADGTTKIYFPAVALDFTWGSNMLQITYMVRNTQWVLTEATRGNQDIDFCAEAKHQNSSPGQPFLGKYGSATLEPDGVTWSGVLATVSNPSKVKSDPAVCGRGGVTIAGESWRTWTVCIPKDWDWGIKPS